MHAANVGIESLFQVWGGGKRSKKIALACIAIVAILRGGQLNDLLYVLPTKL